MRILLIEDDEILTDVLVESLQQQRYVVDTVDDGRFGLEYAESGTYDLLLIDVGLPRLDGISLCQQLRNGGCTKPILLMTAHDAADEKIRGLDAGADDYLTKPLDIAELQARLRALLRRKEVAASSVLEIGQLWLNPESCEVTYAGKLLNLTPKEYSLLELFLRNPNRVFSRGHIVEHLWTFDDPPLEDSVKAHVKGLRRRLKQAGADGWVENVYGLGYKLSPKIDPKTGDEAMANEENIQDNSVEQQFNQAMTALWQQHRSTMSDRLKCLQQAEKALQADALNEALQQHASQAAHKLAGVLGMFGKEEGTAVARSLETLFSKQNLGKDARLEDTTAASKRLQQLTQILNLAEDSSATLISETATSAQPVKILAVDDDPVFLRSLSPLLKPWGMAVTTLSDPAQFWDVLSAIAPDLLILDIEMPQPDGIALCQSIRNSTCDNGRWQSLPILFLSARQNAAAEVFAAGADDYVVKPVLGPELITRITNRLERTRLLKRLRGRDEQTGLCNQTQAQKDLQQLIQGEKPYSFVLLQLKNLTQINLEYGHSMGNVVLKFWGDELSARLPNAIASYWGNGDFVIGLPNMNQTEALELLLAVQKTFRQKIFSTSPDDNTKARFQSQYAVGVAAFPDDGRALSSLYKTAYSRASE